MSVRSHLAATVFAVIAAGHVLGASAQTASYSTATGQLTLPSIVVNGVTFHDVKVTVGRVEAVGASSPASENTYDPATNRATLPSVTVDGGATYSHVVFTPGAVLAIGASELKPTSQSVPFGLRAFNFSAFESDYWSNASDNATALDFIKAEGANAITLDWMIEFADNGTMVANGGTHHPSWSDIASVVTAAKARGLYVVLKPHVISTVCCGQNRNSYNTDAAAFLPANFFPAWKAYLLSMAASLPMAKVDAISIGTELDFVDSANRSEWATLIAAVRGVYAGELTYDAMFSQWRPAKDIDDVVFWDLLDFISCSYYVRLTQDNTLPAAALAQLMRNTPGQDIADPIGYLQEIAARHGKQVFTLEGGYQSANGALWEPNAYYGPAAVENQDLQARGLDAYLFALNYNQGSWLKGVALWDVQPRHVRPDTWNDPNYRNGWGMYNKSAADTVKKWYSLVR